jgi:hypothetical protein
MTVDPQQSGGRPLRNLRIRVKDVLDLLAAGARRCRRCPYRDPSRRPRFARAGSLANVAAIAFFPATRPVRVVTRQPPRWSCLQTTD